MTSIEINTILKKYPGMISKDQFRQICQISPYHAQYLLESQLVPCIIKPKQTHKYDIPITAVIDYMKDREVHPEKYLLPSEFRKNRSKRVKRPTQKQLAALTEHNLLSLYRVTLLKYPDLMSILQVAEAIGYSTKVIYGWCQSKKFISIRSGRKILFPKIALMEFMMTPDFRQISRKSEKHWEMLSKMLK